MTDIEVLRLDWFRGGAYQDLFRFLDAAHGFAKFRWGNHAVRTLGVALFAEDGQVGTVALPYAHQEQCQCPDAGGRHGPCGRGRACSPGPEPPSLLSFSAFLLEGRCDRAHCTRALPEALPE